MDARWRRRLSVFLTHFGSCKDRSSSHAFFRYRTESCPHQFGRGVHVQGMVMTGRSPEARKLGEQLEHSTAGVKSNLHLSPRFQPMIVPACTYFQVLGSLPQTCM